MQFRLKLDPAITVEAMVLPWPGSYTRADGTEVMFAAGSWLVRHMDGRTEVMDAYGFGFTFHPDRRRPLRRH